MKKLKLKKSEKPSFAAFVKGAPSRNRTKIYRKAMRAAAAKQVEMIVVVKYSRTVS